MMSAADGETERKKDILHFPGGEWEEEEGVVEHNSNFFL